MLRLLRVAKLVKYVQRLETILAIKPAMLHIVNLLLAMLLFAHWSGCLQFLLAELYDFPAASWVVLDGLLTAPWGEQYVWAVFKSMSHMLCIGYGRDPPQLTSELIIVIPSMLMGATCYVLLIARISSLLMTVDSAGREYTERLSSLTEYLRIKQVPVALRHSARECFEYRWIQRKYFHDADILADLSDDLQARIRRHTLHELLRHAPIFCGMATAGTPRGHELLDSLIQAMQVKVIMPGETLKGLADVYIVHFGILEATPMSLELSDGDFFGANLLPCDAVVARTPCKLLVIRASLFQAVVAVRWFNTKSGRRKKKEKKKKKKKKKKVKEKEEESKRRRRRRRRKNMNQSFAKW